eukprot:3102156-Amphidinium_carterae.2
MESAIGQNTPSVWLNPAPQIVLRRRCDWCPAFQLNASRPAIANTSITRASRRLVYLCPLHCVRIYYSNSTCANRLELFVRSGKTQECYSHPFRVLGKGVMCCILSLRANSSQSSPQHLLAPRVHITM